MGKSRKKPDSEVDLDPVVVASPSTPIENEKIAMKQVVSSKKQKLDNGDKEQTVEKKNFGMEGEENTKEEQHNSSEEKKAEVSVSPTINSAETTEDAKRGRVSIKYEEKDRDDNSKEDHQTPTRSVEMHLAIKSAETTQDANRTSISNEDGDDNSKEDHHHHLETPTKSVEVPPAIESTPTTPVAKRARISNDHEEEDKDDNSKEDQPQLETPKKSDIDVEMFDASSSKKTAQTSLSSQSPGSKIVLMDNLSFSIQAKDVKNFFKNVGEIAEIHFDMKEDYFTGHGHVEFTTAEAAKEALKLNYTSLLDKPVKLYLATESDHQTTSHATGCKTLFLGNLSFSIEEDDVREFFKDVGEIAGIRFAIRNDRFMGYGYVEFTTAEAAQEALKLNNKVVLDRKVKLDLARERGASTSGSSFEKSNQSGGHAQGRTLYVRGFDYSHGFDNIRSTLEKHFGKCGEISRISIPKEYESGAPRGVAFIDFVESNAFSQALRLDKSEIGGFRIIVEEAKKGRADGREGSGYGSARGGSGGGWGRESGSGGGSSRASDAWHRESGGGNDYGRPGGGWHGESGSGGGSGRVSGGWHRESGSGSGGSDYGGGGSGRASGGWRREGGYGGGGNDYGGGGSGRASGGWHREGGYGGGYKGILGRGSGYGGGFSSSRVGMFNGGYGSSRGGGSRR
ncbi:nucleolin 2 isoform X1 [Lactuca sativa]|uniref:nucleolin 2 isoform X1 n=2 Tax=Lactuca sativa TaxID=4236 RepID=UPI000CD880A8|nr:nucleolin 2 isoform X1 [Lactuca sativa]